jgi:AraC-like DNA-binding protein
VALANAVKVRFFAPPDYMRRYFTTFYHLEFTMPNRHRVVDYLLPDWANLRFHSGDSPDAWGMDGQRLTRAMFSVTGPSSKATQFMIGSGRIWGIGLLPLGWAKFMRDPADDFANALVDGNSHPSFSSFRALGRTLFSEGANVESDLNRIVRYFQTRLDDPVPDRNRILAIHAALVDPETTTVAKLVDRTGASQRTIERVCCRYFGFSPKLLLRRQRFLRSLNDFVLDPSLKWIGAMDSHYHDQAQFVRDFREFMGMTPRRYAALAKPLIGVMMRERASGGRAAAPGLDLP